MLLIPSDSFQTQPDECVPPIHVPYSYIAQFGGANWTGIVATAHTTICYEVLRYDQLLRYLLQLQVKPSLVLRKFHLTS